jgi:hypothetical protein
MSASLVDWSKHGGPHQTASSPVMALSTTATASAGESAHDWSRGMPAPAAPRMSRERRGDGECAGGDCSCKGSPSNAPPDWISAGIASVFARRFADAIVALAPELAARGAQRGSGDIARFVPGPTGNGISTESRIPCSEALIGIEPFLEWAENARALYVAIFGDGPCTPTFRVVPTGPYGIPGRDSPEPCYRLVADFPGRDTICDTTRGDCWIYGCATGFCTARSLPQPVDTPCTDTPDWRCGRFKCAPGGSCTKPDCYYGNPDSGPPCVLDVLCQDPGNPCHDKPSPVCSTSPCPC